jgi:MFS family permease
MERTALSANVLESRDFRKLWAGQGVSLFGSLITRLVLPFFVIYTLSATPMEVAWVRVAEVVPGMALGLMAGIAADRWLRRRIMIVTDLLRAVLVGLIPLFFLLHQLPLALVLVLVVVLSMAGILFDRAYDAYLPTLVPPEQLLDANAKVAGLSSVAEVTGFGVAGALFEWLGGPLTFSVDMASFIVSAMSLWAIRQPEHAQWAPTDDGPVHTDLSLGVWILWQRPAVAPHRLDGCDKQSVLWVIVCRLFAVRQPRPGTCAGLAGRSLCRGRRRVAPDRGDHQPGR